LQHAFLAAQRVNNRFEQSFALYHLGRTAFRLGSPKEAVQYFYNSLDIGAENQDDSSQLNTMGNLVAALAELDDIETAEKIATNALSFARKIDDPESVVGTLNTLAAVAFKKGDENAAEKYLQEAMQQVASLPDYTGLASLLMNMATIVARHGRYQEAESYLQTALSNAELARHYEHIVLSLIGLIGLYLRQDNFEEAENYIQRVLPILETAPLEIATKQLAAYLYTMARVSRGLEHATKYLNIALALAEREENSHLVILILWELGGNAMLVNQFDDAYIAFEKALFLSISGGFSELSLGLLIDLGAAAIEQRNYEDAGRCFTMCLASAKSQGSPSESTVLLLLGRLALIQNHFDQAQLYFKQSADQALCNKDIEGALKALSELGNAALYREEYDIARLHWQKALILARQQEEPSLIGAALIMLATVELRAKQIDFAEETLREAISYATKNNLPDLETVGLYNLIKMYLACGKIEEAHFLGDRCFRLLDEMDDNDTTSEFRQNLTALLKQEQVIKDTDELAKNRHGWVNLR
jgi:tetratricopeptide (TPR) repeat protein